MEIPFPRLYVLLVYEEKTPSVAVISAIVLDSVIDCCYPKYTSGMIF
jgi:hypothetical protein